jgi:hypothetical protein
MEDRFGQSVIVQIDENILKETNIVKCKSLLSLHQSIRGSILETIIIPYNSQNNNVQLISRYTIRLDKLCTGKLNCMLKSSGHSYRSLKFTVTHFIYNTVNDYTAQTLCTRTVLSCISAAESRYTSAH